MSTRTIVLATLAAVAAAWAFAPPAGAQSPAGLQQALDRTVDLVLKDTPILEVFTVRLAAATGIKFVVTDDALECLPYGDQTRLDVTLKDITVRKALPRMLAPQALRWEIRDTAVYIVPSEALYRMGRRATFEELKLLGKMHTEVLDAPPGGGSPLEQLRKVAENPAVELFFHDPMDQDAALRRAARVLPATMADWLDMLCHGQACTWRLEGNRIVVLDQKVQVRDQLQKKVSLRYQNARLATVLSDLAAKARVKLTMEPGVLNYLPVEERMNFGLMMADATVEQALQLISGQTGLKFVPTEEGLHVEASETLKQGAAAPQAARRSPFFIRMALPGPQGVQVEVFFRAEDLPDKLLESLQGEKDKLVRDLCRQYGVPMPQTAPAQTPASGPAD